MDQRVTVGRGPKPSLLSGHFRHLSRDILELFSACEKEGAGMVRLRVWATPFYIANDPELIRGILVASDRDFVKPTGVDVLRPLLGDGLLVSRLEKWERQHRLVQPCFHRGRLPAFARVVKRAVEQSVAPWQLGDQIEAHEAMAAIALEVIARTLFGDETQVRRAVLRKGAHALHEFFLSWRRHYLPIPAFAPTPANLRLKRATRALHEIIDAEIAEVHRTRRPAGDDMLSQLLSARDEAGLGMSDAEARDELVTLLLAGHDTTADWLTWTWVLLARHSDVRARLEEELSVLQGQPPSLEDLPRLTYLDQVLKESLRLYPPLYNIGRVALRTVQIGPYTIERGRNVIISPWALHRSARWFDDPLVFRPERWTPELVSALPKFAYLPFGGGRRVCIGAQFGTVKAKLIVATIAQRFRLELDPATRIELQPAVTLRPAGPVPMTLRVAT